MAFKNSTALRSILWGFGISGLHFLCSVGLAIYHGLGMDPAGARFTKNIFMQPGTAINNAYEGVNPLVVNLFFYFIIGFAVTYLLSRKKGKSPMFNSEKV